MPSTNNEGFGTHYAKTWNGKNIVLANTVVPVSDVIGTQETRIDFYGTNTNDTGPTPSHKTGSIVVNHASNNTDHQSKMTISVVDGADADTDVLILKAEYSEFTNRLRATLGVEADGDLEFYANGNLTCALTRNGLDVTGNMSLIGDDIREFSYQKSMTMYNLFSNEATMKLDQFGIYVDNIRPLLGSAITFAGGVLSVSGNLIALGCDEISLSANLLNISSAASNRTFISTDDDFLYFPQLSSGFLQIDSSHRVYSDNTFDTINLLTSTVEISLLPLGQADIGSQTNPFSSIYTDDLFAGGVHIGTGSGLAVFNSGLLTSSTTIPAATYAGSGVTWGSSGSRLASVFTTALNAEGTLTFYGARGGYLKTDSFGVVTASNALTVTDLTLSGILRLQSNTGGYLKTDGTGAVSSTLAIDATSITASGDGTFSGTLRANGDIRANRDVTLTWGQTILTVGTGAANAAEVLIHGTVQVNSTLILPTLGIGYLKVDAGGNVFSETSVGFTDLNVAGNITQSGNTDITTGTGTFNINSTVFCNQQFLIRGDGSLVVGDGLGVNPATFNDVAYFLSDIEMTGSGTFSTAVGGVFLNGNVTIASGKNLTMVAAGSGSFTTGTGAVNLNGTVTIASGKNLTMSGSSTFATGTGTVSLNGSVSIASGKSFTHNGSGNFTIGSGTVTINGPTTVANTLGVSSSSSSSLVTITNADTTTTTTGHGLAINLSSSAVGPQTGIIVTSSSASQCAGLRLVSGIDVLSTSAIVMSCGSGSAVLTGTIEISGATPVFIFDRQIELPLGTVGAPSLIFDSMATTGIFAATTPSQSVSIAIGGQNRFSVSDTTITTSTRIQSSSTNTTSGGVYLITNGSSTVTAATGTSNAHGIVVVMGSTSAASERTGIKVQGTATNGTNVVTGLAIRATTSTTTGTHLANIYLESNITNTIYATTLRNSPTTVTAGVAVESCFRISSHTLPETDAALDLGSRLFGTGTNLRWRSAYFSSTVSASVINLLSGSNSTNLTCTVQAVTGSATTVTTTTLGSHFLPETTGVYDIGSTNTSGGVLLRWRNAYITGVVNAAGTNLTSDRNLKKDIETSPFGLDFIKKLQPRRYHMIQDDGRYHYGFIAQEIRDMLLQNGMSSRDFAAYVGLGSDFDNDDHEEGTRSIAYHEFISPMIKSIQELSESVDEQRAQIELQQSQIERQQDQINQLLQALGALRA